MVDFIQTEKAMTQRSEATKHSTRRSSKTHLVNAALKRGLSRVVVIRQTEEVANAACDRSARSANNGSRTSDLRPGSVASAPTKSLTQKMGRMFFVGVEPPH